jgi:hypothetical protein
MKKKVKERRKNVRRGRDEVGIWRGEKEIEQEKEKEEEKNKNKEK